VGLSVLIIVPPHREPVLSENDFNRSCWVSSGSYSALKYSAGVAGLTTALILARKGYKVTLVAEFAPGDLSIYYTSPWAVACHV